jgi:hypothetical protein
LPRTPPLVKIGLALTGFIDLPPADEQVPSRSVGKLGAGLRLHETELP